MKKSWLVTGLLACLLVAAADLAPAATDGSCAAGEERADACPATALVARWEQAAERLAALPAETRQSVARARATLSASCPVCQEAPASFALLGRLLDSTVALDGQILAFASTQGECEAPQEIREAFAQRVAIGARARELHAAFTRAMASLEPCHAAEGGATHAADAPDAPPSLAAVAQDLESIAGEAERLAATWKTIPARAAALPEATKSQLFEAMGVLQREVQTCELAGETMSVLAQGLERLVALDRTLAAHCEATSRTRGEELAAELAPIRRASGARTQATARALELLRVMQASMTPEIFETGAATTVVGAGR